MCSRRSARLAGDDITAAQFAALDALRGGDAAGGDATRSPRPTARTHCRTWLSDHGVDRDWLIARRLPPPASTPPGARGPQTSEGTALEPGAGVGGEHFSVPCSPR